MKLLVLALGLFLSTKIVAQKFTAIDKKSKLHFVIKNFGINTGGDITGMKGKIYFDAKQPSMASFNVTADVVTLDTDNQKRDNHLKNDEYFDAVKFAIIRLESKQILPGADLKHFIFRGNLTIKNVTKSVEFPFTAEGKDGGALFSAVFEINRIDFGVGKQSMALSNKVKIDLSVFAQAN